MIFVPPASSGGYDPNSYTRGQAVRKLREYAKENPHEFQWRLRPWPIGIEEDSRIRLFELLSENPENVEDTVTFYFRPRSEEVLERAVDRAELIGIRWFEFETIELSYLEQKASEAGFNISTRLRTRIEEIREEREAAFKKGQKQHRITMLILLFMAFVALFFMYQGEIMEWMK